MFTLFWPKRCSSLNLSQKCDCLSTLASCTLPGKPMRRSQKSPFPPTTACKMIECHPFLLKKSRGYSVGAIIGMWLPSITPTHCGTLHRCSKKLAISTNFLASGNLMCTGRSTLFTVSQKSFTQLKTVVRPTPKMWLTLLYSPPVASFHRAMATHFLKGTHKQ